MKGLAKLDLRSQYPQVDQVQKDADREKGCVISYSKYEQIAGAGRVSYRADFNE